MYNSIRMPCAMTDFNTILLYLADNINMSIIPRVINLVDDVSLNGLGYSTHMIDLINMVIMLDC